MGIGAGASTVSLGRGLEQGARIQGRVDEVQAVGPLCRCGLGWVESAAL